MTILTVDPSFSLAQLNQFVTQSESGLQGPLTSIGNHNNKTIIKINDLDPAGGAGETIRDYNEYPTYRRDSYRCGSGLSQWHAYASHRV